MASASAINSAIPRNMPGRGVVRAEKRITLVILNEDMDDIIRIMKPLENSGILIVKYEKRQQDGFLGLLLGNLVASRLGNILTTKGVMKAGKGVVRAVRGYDMHCMDKVFSSSPSFKQYRDVSIMSIGLMEFIQEITFLN